MEKGKKLILLVFLVIYFQVGNGQWSPMDWPNWTLQHAEFHLCDVRDGKALFLSHKLAQVMGQGTMYESKILRLHEFDLNSGRETTLFPKEWNLPESYACYGRNTNEIFFDSKLNDNGTNGRYSKIFAYDKTLGGKFQFGIKLNLKGFNQEGYNCVQPIYFVKEKLLVFSSDKKGGEGGFDLYGTFNQDSCWSPVFSLGREVNTAGDEIFPSELNGELSFTRLVSDQKRNYSVPLNSQFFGVKDQQSLPTCIRMIEIAPNVVYLERENKFYFYKKDVTSEYYTLRLTNELGEPLLCELRMERNEGFSSINLLSNIQGETEKFSFSKNEKVKFILGDKCREISGFIYATLYTSDGNAIRKYKFNRKGELILELLDFVFSDLSYKENKDFSVLCCEYDKSVFKQTTLYFDNNSFEIDAANIEIFNKWFSENVSLVTGGKFILTSYTSGDGLKERNLKLAEDRIKSGVKILLERGVELRQIDTKIGGLDEQVLDGRRIEIQFIPL